MQIKKRRPKKPKISPEQQAYKYACSNGHIRIEKDRLADPLPVCAACEKAGTPIRFTYVGRYTIPKNQLSKSKFSK